ncbi:TPA: AAA family ATPase [Citrobacter braakii]|uniref:AAA family ATPase n=1 Tax=unclassified Citrobacter TaxID=2644389 RepID=UPI0015E9AD51|nr:MULTISPECIES: AAA family ATPase [unclassified Citrobacter]HCB1681172.1 AAA family ATPase [Citrobacter braakii]MDM3314886.1 AAA family ATPase [Citrobacter sp. Cb220]QLR49367.1 AAA family ATPase [Citrobacter sp. RHBSTW-00986]HEM7930756.1 AAA family ATPase [Citrobacter braakii]HEM7957463.1 AAA family ATPase [Citrobacter braakii]
MLKGINIHGFKSLGAANLLLSPLTILTGTNSSGKSSVLQALMLLIKHSASVNQYSMEDVIRFLADFSIIRNKKINAKSIVISAQDIENNSHTLTLNAENTDIDSRLGYQYEPRFVGGEPELLYLNANRLGAQEMVPVSERRVGGAGEHLFSTFDKMKHLPVPDYLVKASESTTLAYQLSYWLKLITGTTSELVTEKVGDQVKVAFTLRELEGNVSPLNLGAGMSYIAKVLIICLMAKKGDLILLENPEIQLHPKAQAHLAIFLSFIASKGIQIIVETHCEHLINRLAYQVYDDEIASSDVVVHYKPNVDESFISLLIDGDGEFTDLNNNKVAFPKGFFDATLAELMEMR